MTAPARAPDRQKAKAKPKPDLYLVKVSDGVLVPAHGDEYTREMIAGIKTGELVCGKFKKPRNPLFHRKFFAMLGVGFEAWEPREYTNQHGPITKQFEQFREDVTILAGFYEQTIRLDGGVRTVAKSISFSSMNDLEFARVYSSVADVILQKVLTNYTREDLDSVVQSILDFV